MDAKTISLIQFNTGRKVTFDEDRFEVLVNDNDIFVVLKDQPEKIALRCKWDSVLYIRHGVYKKIKPQPNRRSTLGIPSNVVTVTSDEDVTTPVE